ncbi:DUF6036 family nucleotidyltransferase [Pseudomonas putida]|uniref:DUF6036 family nucleotidyltransferase n=1 Tax=Pseudomonas putida TaxID=303 RepID=UPI000AAD2DA0|nr:DUF6036 family nucleotidyltransferase [Pseudomonas putida]
MLHLQTPLAQAVRQLFDRALPLLAGRPPATVKVYVFGGCALHMLTNARGSADVDAEIQASEHLLRDEIRAIYAAPEDYEQDGLDLSVVFDQQFNNALCPLHEDYDARAILLPSQERSPLQVFIAHPIDLAISKLNSQLDDPLTELRALACSDMHTTDQLARQALDHLVVQATKASLDKLDKAVAETFALLFWYRNEDMRGALENRLNMPRLAPVRKRRLMYLVDRLRRFPCMKPDQAEQMKKLVARWKDLSHGLNAKLVEKAQAVNRYDKVAATWGVAEPVSSLMNMVLDLQTRHFVDAHHLPNGYAKLTTHASKHR